MSSHYSEVVKETETYGWTQSHYMGQDSGFHTGATTGAPSMMSGASSLHDDLINYGDSYGANGYNDTVQDMNEAYNATRSQRIRAAMFPETMDEGADTGHRVDLGQSSNVGRLAEGSQLMKSAVVNIINYQDDADLATRAIPELIRLLADPDQAVVGHAAKLIHEMSKKEASLRAMLGFPELTAAVIRTLERGGDEKVMRDAAGTLYQLSQHEPGLLAIFRSGGIRALVLMLDSPYDAIVFYAITTLHNLILHQDGAIAAVRQEGGVGRMTGNLDRPLHRKGDKFLAILTDCLKILCFKHPDSKMRVLGQSGPAKLVNIMRTSQYEKLLWTTSRLLKVLSVCPQNKMGIVEAGGMQALETHLHGPSPRLTTSALLAIRNLSDAATKEENVERLLDSLLAHLSSQDLEVVALSAGTLSNLSCNNQRNKAYLCQKGGIQVLLRTLHTHVNSADIAEPALCTLRHLTIRHPHAESAQNEVRHHQGIPLVVHFLRTNRLPLMKAVLGLVRNLVNNPANRAPIRDCEVVQLSAAALQNAFMALHEAQLARQEPPVQEGVSVVEIVEAAASALQSLAKDDPANRALLLRLPLLPILVNLLASDHDGILRGVTGLLCELSADKDGALSLEREGAVPPLTELMHSKNTHVNTYAAGALFNINKDKPGDYGSRLDQEISAALCRDDSGPWTNDGVSDMHSLPDDPAYSDMVYNHATYDPTASMEQMGLGSPNNNAHLNSSYQPSHHSSAHPPGGWFDTDL